MKAVQQCKAKTWGDVMAFAATLATAGGSDRGSRGIGDGGEAAKAWVPLVIKPLRGCASGDVFLCRSEEQARSALATILGSPLYGTPGAVNEVSDSCTQFETSKCSYFKYIGVPVWI